MRYTEQDIERITSSVSPLDYFQYLEKQGKVQYEKKAGGDFYFRTDNEKFSVNDKGYYDFKSGQGGQIIKAVMKFENKNWIQAMDFLKDFSNTYIQSEDYAQRKQKIEQTENPNKATIERAIVPNNQKLIEYFENRGIDKDILKAYTKQVHYKFGDDKRYFGIGLKNESEGYEIRNPMMKTKLGKGDISIIQGTGKNAIVFEGMTDMLSFMQLQKLNNRENKSTLVVLNSVVNDEKFVERFKDFKGKVSLLLDGDDAGEHTTQNIIKSLPNVRVEDVRYRYGLNENSIKDLNEYLINRNTPQDIILEKGMRFVHKESGEERFLHNVNKDSLYLRVDYSPSQSKVNSLGYSDIHQVLSNFDVYDMNDKKLDISEKNRIFTKSIFSENLIELTTKNQEKNQEYEQHYQTNKGESAGISEFKPNERRDSVSNDRGTHETSQSERGDTDREPKELDSHDAGNGFGTLFGESVGRRGLQPTGSDGTAQQGIRPTDTPIRGEERQGDRQDIYDHAERREQGESEKNVAGTQRPTLVEESLEEKIKSLKGQKISNEQITELVNALAFVDENKQIQIKEGVEITDDIKEILTQFKSGGTTKEGRGILDEYYTDSKLVEATYNLIQDQFPKQNIKILEPSIGVGNFVAPAEQLGLNAQIKGFEINETTAKIAKLLHPSVEVNLRSFESEFINEIGQKKPFEKEYDVVVGNPPYGEHRGLYKGLGEEPKIAKYEDYFVKRSLDVMKEGGTLAMVLPSGWLNRQNKLSGAEISQAYRLPSGAFKDTQIGTDIIILKKNSEIQKQDISKYFEENPAHILGEKTERSNRFGKMEEFVKGNLDDALQRLEQLKTKTHYQQIGDLFSQAEEEIKENENVEKDSSSTKKSAETKEPANEKLLQETLTKVEHTLESLGAVKFKSINNINDRHFFESQRRELKFKPENFDDERLTELGKRADSLTERLVKRSEEFKNNEYRVQNTPDLKKGVLKYHFVKEDETVATGLQNSPNITDRQVEAFRNTHYDGVIKEPEKYQEFANYYKGDYIHDFYYAEGNIYEKLDTLEQDKDNISQEQYEKQKKSIRKRFATEKRDGRYYCFS